MFVVIKHTWQSLGHSKGWIWRSVEMEEEGSPSSSKTSSRKSVPWSGCSSDFSCFSDDGWPVKTGSKIWLIWMVGVWTGSGRSKATELIESPVSLLACLATGKKRWIGRAGNLSALRKVSFLPVASAWGRLLMTGKCEWRCRWRSLAECKAVLCASANRLPMTILLSGILLVKRRTAERLRPAKRFFRTINFFPGSTSVTWKARRRRPKQGANLILRTGEPDWGITKLIDLCLGVWVDVWVVGGARIIRGRCWVQLDYPRRRLVGNQLFGHDLKSTGFFCSAK